MTGEWVEGSVNKSTTPAPKKTSDTAASASGAKPRGRPPKGKTWNEETGGWVASGEGAPPPPTKRKKVSHASSGKAPRGRPPRGKKWDATTGAWVVDDEANSKEGSPPAKKSKTDKDGDSSGQQLASSSSSSSQVSVKKPRGRPPKGKTWNMEMGLWVEAETALGVSGTNAAALSPKSNAAAEKLARLGGSADVNAHDMEEAKAALREAETEDDDEEEYSV